MRKTPYNHCRNTGKRSYRSEEMALRYLQRCHKRESQLRRQHIPRILRAEKRAYQCDWCSGWHLTSQAEAA